MNVTLYHGSNNKFEIFEIDKKHSNYKDETGLKEGYGIYLSTDKTLARGYGIYLYEVQVETNEVTDYSKKNTVKRIIQEMEKAINIPLSYYLDVKALTENVLRGRESVVKLGEEITKILDNNEYFYTEYSDKITDEEDCIYESIKESYMNSIKDVLKYPDNDFNGDIYICHRNPHKLKVKLIEEDSLRK